MHALQTNIEHRTILKSWRYNIRTYRSTIDFFDALYWKRICRYSRASRTQSNLQTGEFWSRNFVFFARFVRGIFFYDTCYHACVVHVHEKIWCFRVFPWEHTAFIDIRALIRTMPQRLLGYDSVAWQLVKQARDSPRIKKYMHDSKIFLTKPVFRSNVATNKWFWAAKSSKEANFPVEQIRCQKIKYLQNQWENLENMKIFSLSLCFHNY